MTSWKKAQDSVPAPDSPDGALDSASDDEMFDLINREFGIS
jgi:hypothetical protein